MRDVLRAGVAAATVFGLISTHVTQAPAAGALAVGACAAYGYAYDYPSSEAANGTSSPRSESSPEARSRAARKWRFS